MPRKAKINLEKVKASLFTLCTACRYTIPPAELHRLYRSGPLPEVRDGLHSRRDGGQ